MFLALDRFRRGSTGRSKSESWSSGSTCSIGASIRCMKKALAGARVGGLCFDRAASATFSRFPTSLEGMFDAMLADSARHCKAVAGVPRQKYRSKERRESAVGEGGRPIMHPVIR